MRVLFSTIPEKSHLYCLTPLAWAARAAGHEVRVASCREFVDTIARTGMTAVGVGTSEGIAEGLRSGRDQQEGDALDWNELDPAKLTYEEELNRAQMMAYGSVMYNEPMIDELAEFARAWQPDLVVWDNITYAGPLVAASVGAAHARSLTYADVWVAKRQLLRKLAADVPAEQRRDPLGDWLAARVAQLGGTFCEEIVTGQLTLDPLPPSLGVPTEARRAPVRFVPYNGVAVEPDWLREPPRKPRVCLSLGSTNTERYGGDYVSTTDILAAVAELDVEVVAALLPAQIRELGALPDNVRAVSSVPLHTLLPSCSLLIHHGGTGSYCNALMYGVPQLIATTRLIDQVYRGRTLQQQGAGRVLRARDAAPERVRDTVAELLADPSVTANAERLRDEAMAHPSPAQVVSTLEQLVADRRG